MKRTTHSLITLICIIYIAPQQAMHTNLSFSERFGPFKGTVAMPSLCVDFWGQLGITGIILLPLELRALRWVAGKCYTYNYTKTIAQNHLANIHQKYETLLDHPEEEVKRNIVTILTEDYQTADRYPLSNLDWYSHYRIYKNYPYLYYVYHLENTIAWLQWYLYKLSNGPDRSLLQELNAVAGRMLKIATYIKLLPRYQEEFTYARMEARFDTLVNRH